MTLMVGPEFGRGATNANVRGNSEDRRRRKLYLLRTYRADVDVLFGANMFTEMVTLEPVPLGQGAVACRCYRCGDLLVFETLTVDKIVPQCQGGTYRRDNIRPACGRCNSATGATTRKKGKP